MCSMEDVLGKEGFNTKLYKMLYYFIHLGVNLDTTTIIVDWW